MAPVKPVSVRPERMIATRLQRPGGANPIGMAAMSIAGEGSVSSSGVSNETNTTTPSLFIQSNEDGARYININSGLSCHYRNNRSSEARTSAKCERKTSRDEDESDGEMHKEVIAERAD